MICLNKPRYLEGELFINNGYLWIVKGYQHPFGKLIALPRYNLINGSKLSSHVVVNKPYYWSCLKIETPVIDLDNSFFYKPAVDNNIDHVVKTLSQLIGFENYTLTGSTALSSYIEPRDIDILVYGFKNEYVENIENYLKKELFKPIDYYTLYNEYLIKHSSRLDHRTYFSIKRNTLLHFIYRNIHINLRITKHEHGFHQCIDPVYKREFFTDEISIVDYIDKYTTPSKYIAQYRDTEFYLETYREVYAELPRGKYYVNGFLEYRKNGLYIIPDHGYLIYLNA